MSPRAVLPLALRTILGGAVFMVLGFVQAGFSNTIEFVILRSAMCQPWQRPDDYSKRI
jgi:hypothetical protein